ncbi:MAG TPA: MbtH domain protein [Acidobacteriota bacterium]|nr:MbtH domain protein [Acidobacteriota bacterium]
MSQLVKRLAEGRHPVTASRAEGSVSKFKESLDRNYVHIEFTGTRGGTELEFELDQDCCKLEADFEKGQGTVHLEGLLNLDDIDVRCRADIQLETLSGTGHLVVTD